MRVNTYHGISRAAGRHLDSPAVAPELRSGGGTAGVCRGGRLHWVDTRTKVDRWKTLFDYPNPAYLCMMDRGGIPADLSNHVGKVYNLYRVYSNSRVLGHGRLERSLHCPMSSLGFIKRFFRK
jgi:hypothetical protein